MGKKSRGIWETTLPEAAIIPGLADPARCYACAVARRKCRSAIRTCPYQLAPSLIFRTGFLFAPPAIPLEARSLDEQGGLRCLGYQRKCRGFFNLGNLPIEIADLLCVFGNSQIVPVPFVAVEDSDGPERQYQDSERQYQDVARADHQRRRLFGGGLWHDLNHTNAVRDDG